MAEGTSAPGGNQPDGVTTDFNSNGQLQVQTDGQTIFSDSNGLYTQSQQDLIIGDFENNNSGGWTLGGSSDISSANPYNGTYHANVFYGSMDLDRDLTNISKLVFYEKGFGSDLYVELDGSEVYRNNVNSGYNKVELDVSNYSGTTTISFNEDPGSGVYVDYIYLVKAGLSTSSTVVTNDAGGSV